MMAFDSQKTETEDMRRLVSAENDGGLFQSDDASEVDEEECRVCRGPAEEGYVYCH